MNGKLIWISICIVVLFGLYLTTKEDKTLTKDMNIYEICLNGYSYYKYDGYRKGSLVQIKYQDKNIIKLKRCK